MTHKYVVQINYKSGRSVVIRCEHFAFKGKPSIGLTEVEWENASPQPLFIGVDEIESIWKLSSRHPSLGDRYPNIYPIAAVDETRED